MTAWKYVISNTFFYIFYAMAAAPPDVCRFYDCELGYDDVERLFVHNKEAHFDVEANFSILCLKVDSQSRELSTSTGQWINFHQTAA